MQNTYGMSVFGELLPNPNASKLLSEKFCRARQVVPVEVEGDKTLILAMVDPADVLTLDDVRFFTGMEIRPVAATLAAMREAWDIAYAGGVRLESERVEAEPASPADRQAAEQDTVVSLVNEIILSAMRRKASDIHFEPQVDRMAVRTRVDGILYHLRDIDLEMKNGVVSRIKIIGNMDIAERRLPQDGRATFHTDEGSVDLRIASIPSVFGESIVIRLLDDRAQAITLESLGMTDDGLLRFRKAINRPWGEILVTGPTGSGKSTTLYAALEEVNNSKVKIYTVEDPVERRIPGVLQSQVQSAIGLTFASMLRSLVRSDPDVIMIGEIRDHETALIATEASLTGHLVLSTLHTNDAPTAITRLVEMGLPAYLVVSALELIVAQRLARCLCPHCKRMVSLTRSKMTQAERDFLGDGATKIAKQGGCNRCNGTGYSGRTGLFEILPLSQEIRNLVLNHATAEAIREQAVSAGMRTLREDGRLKVLDGLTTIEEVERVTT